MGAQKTTLREQQKEGEEADTPDHNLPNSLTMCKASYMNKNEENGWSK